MPRNIKSDDFSIRPGTPEDARNFYKLDRICFPPQVAFSLGVFKYHLKDRDSVNIVAEERATPEQDALIIGFIVAQVFDDTGQIVTMDVHPDRRRKRIGSALLDACEKEMAVKGARRSVLQVAVDNVSAISLYTKSGYRPIGRIPGYYPHPRPHGTDAFFMEKTFTV